MLRHPDIHDPTVRVVVHLVCFVYINWTLTSPGQSHIFLYALSMHRILSGYTPHFPSMFYEHFARCLFRKCLLHRLF